MTRRHRSGGLVCSSLEDRPSAVGKWSIPIHALVNDCDLCTLCPYLTNPFFGTPLPSSSSVFCSAKTPTISACTIQRNTYGCRCSPENTLLTSMRLLLLRRGQPSCKGLLPLFGCLEVNCGVTPYKRLGKISDILHLNNENNQLKR